MREQYGVYDKVDNCWMGTETGPLLYTDATLPGVPAAKMAAVAAAVMTEQTGWPEGRLIPRFYDDDATQLRDKIDVPITGLEAIQRIESRVTE